MQFVFFLEPTQDRNRIFDRRLADEHGLETPRQRGILLDIFAVFVEGRRADAMQCTAGERGFEQVAGIHRAFRCARANEGVQFVDEQDDFARRRVDFIEHGFQALLEFAAEFRPGDERTKVEREQLFVLQRLRHITLDDAQREAFDDRGFTDAGFADQHRIVLRAARQHLNRAADFLVATDDGVKLAGGCQFR